MSIANMFGLGGELPVDVTVLNVPGGGGGLVTLNGVQTLTNKTFSNTTNFTAATDAIELTGTTPGILFQPGGSGNTYTLEAAANPGSNTVIDLSTLTGFVTLSGTQTLSNKTFSNTTNFSGANGIELTNATPAIVFQPNGGGNTYTLEAAANPASNTVIDMSTVVTTTGTQSLTNKTFTTDTAFSAATNAIVLTGSTPEIQFQNNGTGNYYTLGAATNPGSNTAIDLSTVVTTTGTQTLSNKTFSTSTPFTAANAIELTGTTPAIVFQPGGSGNTYTLEASSNPASNTVIQLSSITSGVAPTINVTTTTTLTSAQSSSLIYISSTGSAYTITLPAASAGLYYRFFVANTLTAAVTISAPTSGTLYVTNSGAGASGSKTNLILGTTAGIATEIFLTMSGTNWYGTYSYSSGITFS
jgi:hypothetical protein